MGDTMTQKKNSGQVEILEEKLIKPSSRTPDHLRVYTLSFLDQLAPPCYTSLIYFFPQDGAVNAAETSRRLQRLETTLSDILSCYYPLAGRISSADVVSVDCQDQGIPFVVAKVSSHLNDFVEKGREDVDFLSCLAPPMALEVNLATAPPIRVQINLFQCGGVAMGADILHIIADGFSGTKFMADWAKMNHFTGISITDTSGRDHSNNNVLYPTGSQELVSPPISFDAAMIFPPQVENLSDKLQLYPPRGLNATKIVARRLLFDGATVLRLKKEVMSSGYWSFDRPPSKVEVVTAVVWRGLIRTSQAKHGCLRPSMTTLGVNLRGKVLPGLPENTLGNLYIPVPIKFMADAGDESKMGLHDFIFLIRNALQKTLAECKRHSKDEICAVILKAHMEGKEWTAKEDEIDAVFGSSLCRFPTYDVDFGWGTPCWVSMLKVPVPMFWLMDTKCGTGVEVLLDLYEEDMQSSIHHIMASKVATSI